MIFEGGGAKGISHVGAFKALEDANYWVVGVAGSSAGAIVASLVAVGYAADELFDANNAERNIVRANGQTCLGILGGVAEWAKAKSVFDQLKTLKNFPIEDLSTAGVLRRIAAGFAAGWSTFKLTKRLDFITKKGILSTTPLKVFLNEILRKRVLEVYELVGLPTEGIPQQIRFRDIDPYLNQQEELGRYFTPLNIVVTNLSTSSMVVFGKSTPDVVVAEAVAASACIPLLFQPAQVPSYTVEPSALFSDGGMVSNLPTWVFADERRAVECEVDANILTIALSLSAGKNLKPVSERNNLPFERTTFEYVKRVAETSVFGGQNIVNSFMDDLFVIPVDTALDTTDFDLQIPDAIQAYKAGYNSAIEALVDRRDRLRMIQTLLQGFHAWAKSVVILNRKENSRATPVLRACVVERHGAFTYRVTHTFSMEEHADDRLFLHPANKGAPRAFMERDAVYLDQIHSLKRQELLLTKYQKAMVFKDLSSMICLPVFKDLEDYDIDEPMARGEPVAILCIDSSDELALEFDQDDFLDHMSDYALLLSGYY